MVSRLFSLFLFVVTKELLKGSLNAEIFPEIVFTNKCRSHFIILLLHSGDFECMKHFAKETSH